MKQRQENYLLVVGGASPRSKTDHLKQRRKFHGEGNHARRCGEAIQLYK
jgi:hypothetical protein